MLTKDELKSLYEDITSNCTTCDCYEGFECDGFKIYLKIVAEQEKYRWHDLRKNPDDLPVNEHEVDIAYIGYKGIKKNSKSYIRGRNYALRRF